MIAKTELAAIQETALQEDRSKADVEALEDEDMEEAKPTDVSMQITEGINSMIASLSSMKAKADETLAETQLRKRQKTAKTPAEAPVHTDGSNSASALQAAGPEAPFGVPGQ